MEIWLYNVRANLEKDIKTKQNFNLNACEYFCIYALSSREFFPCKGLRVCAITPKEPQNGWVKIFLEAGAVVLEVTCGFTQREPQEIGTKISRAIYVSSVPVSCSKRWLVRGTTVKEVLEMCGRNSRR